MKEKITIVGGGLAGSLLSILLARKGYRIQMFERRSDMRSGNYEGGRSINLALSTRGLTALSKVGLDKEILDISIPMYGRMIHDKEGKLSYQPYGKDEQAIYSVSRGALNIKLLQLADAYSNISMQFECTCTDSDLNSRVSLFKDKFGNEFQDEADYVIATDGAFSAVRDAFQKGGRFNYSQQYELHGYKELEIPAGLHGEFLLNKNCLHIWPRKSFMMIALPNPDGSFTCTLFLSYTGEPGFDDLNSKQEIIDFFTQEFPDAVPLMPTLVEDFLKNPIGTLVTIRCFPWVKNNTALLGDACHAIVPFYGQGMNCAFEDCIVFDDLLDRHQGDFHRTLEAYQNSRKPNADAIADLALQNFIEMRDLVGTPEFLHKKHLEHELTELYPEKFKSQYELVTFSTVPYSFALEQGTKNNALLDFIIANQKELEITDEAYMHSLFDKFLTI